MDPEILEAFRTFEKCNVSEFRNRVLPNSVENLIETVCEKYIGGSDTERDEIRRLVKFEISFLFFLFSLRETERAVQEHCERQLTRAAIALVIENLTFDSRESTIGISIVCDGANRIGLDAIRFLLRMAEISSAEMSRLIGKFVDREPKDKAVDLFGFRAGVDAKGNFAYKALE